MPLKYGVTLPGFLNLNKLILIHSRKILPRASGGLATTPPNQNARLFSQPDMLLERRSAERTTASHRAIDRAWRLIAILHGNFDACSNGGAIRLHSHQVHGDPIVVAAGISEQAKCVTVSGNRPANFLKKVFMAVVAHVRKCHPITLVELACSRRCSDVGEKLSILVVQQNIGNQRSVSGIPGPEINVEKAVVLNVAKVRAHGHENAIQMRFLGDVAERAISHVSVEFQRLGISRKSQIASQCLFGRYVVAGYEETAGCPSLS